MSQNLYIVPYDFTPVGDAAIHYALHLSRNVKAKILVLHLASSKPEGQKAIDCMETKDKDAQSWYLKAIMAARAKDATNMTTYLKKCIQMDSKYKQIAMEDLEFINFFKSNEFRSAVN